MTEPECHAVRTCLNAFGAYIERMQQSSPASSASSQVLKVLYALRDELDKHWACGLSPTVIARQCGVHRNTLAAWRADPTQGTIQTLLAVAAWLIRQEGLRKAGLL